MKTKEEIHLAVSKAINYTLSRPKRDELVGEDLILGEDLGLDSLDEVEVLMGAEEYLQMSVPDEIFNSSNPKSVKSLVDTIFEAQSA